MDPITLDSNYLTETSYTVSRNGVFREDDVQIGTPPCKWRAAWEEGV